MSINYLALFVATVVQFVCGAIWYGPIFGKQWMKIHNCDHLSKAEMDKMAASMGPWYALQFFVTIVTSVVLGLLLKTFPAEWNAFALTAFFWIGFVVPTQVSAVIFGGTEAKWIFPKIAITAFGSLLCLEVATVVFHFMV